MLNKRIYVAAPWVDREQIVELVKQLEDAGATITHRWWEYEGESQTKEPPEFLQKCAELDVNGVLTADVVVVYNSSKSEGKAVEQGIAIATRKPIICITPATKPSMNVFHYLPNYTHVTSIEEGLRVLYE